MSSVNDITGHAAINVERIIDHPKGECTRDAGRREHYSMNAIELPRINRALCFLDQIEYARGALIEVGGVDL